MQLLTYRSLEQVTIQPAALYKLLCTLFCSDAIPACGGQECGEGGVICTEWYRRLRLLSLGQMHARPQQITTEQIWAVTLVKCVSVAVCVYIL